MVFYNTRKSKTSYFEIQQESKAGHTTNSDIHAEMSSKHQMTWLHIQPGLVCFWYVFGLAWYVFSWYVFGQHNYLRLLKTVRYLDSS